MMNQKELLNNYSTIDLLKLPEKFKKLGFTYELVKRIESKCIYKQKKSDVVRYEVFITKITHYREKLKKFMETLGRVINEHNYQEYKEIYPCDTDFGRRAWTYSTLADAEKRYHAIK